MILIRKPGFSFHAKLIQWALDRQIVVIWVLLIDYDDSDITNVIKKNTAAAWIWSDTCNDDIVHTNGTTYIAIAEHLLSKNQSDQAENNAVFPEV